MATGLALMCLDQMADFEEEVQRSTRPQGIREKLEWEMRTGKLYNDEKNNFYDSEDNPGITSPLNSL